MSRIVELPHGGSGPYGITTYTSLPDSCLIAYDLQQKYGSQRWCTTEYFVVGSMLHSYLELWRNGEIGPTAVIEFVDSVCGFAPSTEWQEEARRLAHHYMETQAVDKFGEVVAAEMQINDEALNKWLGARYTAQIDLVARNGGIAIVDYKSASRSGDTYGKGAKRLQLVAYATAVEFVLGEPVKQIFIEQIVKTKVPQVNTYEQRLPDVFEKEGLRKFLQGVTSYVQHGHRYVRADKCEYCVWYQNGYCINGETV